MAAYVALCLLHLQHQLSLHMQAALTKIGRLEDMDVQLRSQLEKLIAQRNQLNGVKAARVIEVI